mmetsp:Transcript_1500/g.4243  ORF Transcript_1500/g.4243 Transcript_1500/m.4243 type:complete len:490 (-) Transcript_1500:454-1923(-)
MVRDITASHIPSASSSAVRWRPRAATRTRHTNWCQEQSISRYSVIGLVLFLVDGAIANVAAAEAAAAAAVADSDYSYFPGWFANISSSRENRWLDTCRQAQDGPGVYWVSGQEAVCDTVTDGGGWTLVYSGNAPPSDYGGPWYPDLKTLQPQRRDGLSGHLWWEIKLSPSVSDMRFACALEPCRDPYACDYDVDLLFFNTLWYNHIASGKTDEETCFGLTDFSSHFLAPKRCNMLNGECTSEFWKTGEFSGEKSCGSEDDFTVDFDDRGRDSNETDGTDWGLDDGVWKCGTRACDPAHEQCSGSWFIWVRHNTEGKDLFDRIFGVKGWLEYLFYLATAVSALSLPILATCCARWCFKLATELADPTVEQIEYMRPKHTEGNYPEHLIRTYDDMSESDFDESTSSGQLSDRRLSDPTLHSVVDLAHLSGDSTLASQSQYERRAAPISTGTTSRGQSGPSSRAKPVAPPAGLEDGYRAAGATSGRGVLELT